LLRRLDQNNAFKAKGKLGSQGGKAPDKGGGLPFLKNRGSQELAWTLNRETRHGGGPKRAVIKGGGGYLQKKRYGWCGRLRGHKRGISG